MFIKFRCFMCGHKLKALPVLAGKRARCTRCCRTLVVPEAQVDRSMVPNRVQEVIAACISAQAGQAPSPLSSRPSPQNAFDKLEPCR